MGMSLSADVFYGFDLGHLDDIDEDEMPQWWQDDEEWEEVLARKLGWVEVPHSTGPEPEGLNNYRLPHEERDRLYAEYRATPEYRGWSANRDELRDLANSIGVEIDSYGYEYGGKCVRIKASAQGCDYGPQRLAPLEVDPSWGEQLARFCELLELPIPDDGPGWHLCASWG